MSHLQIASQFAKNASQQPDNPVRTHSHWGVVFTHPHAERWAVKNIARAGYRCYLPTFIARRTKRAVTQTVEMPLFSRYAFVALANDEPWTPIRYAHGVVSLLMTNGKPQHANAGVVEALQAGEAARRTIHPPGAVWSPGDPCRLAQGPCHGLDAVVLTADDNNHLATVAIMMLGQLRKIKIIKDWLIERSE